MDFLRLGIVLSLQAGTGSVDAPRDGSRPTGAALPAARNGDPAPAAGPGVLPRGAVLAVPRGQGRGDDAVRPEPTGDGGSAAMAQVDPAQAPPGQTPGRVVHIPQRTFPQSITSRVGRLHWTDRAQAAAARGEHGEFEVYVSWENGVDPGGGVSGSSPGPSPKRASPGPFGHVAVRR